jgi:hypothetical protein
LCNCVCGPPPAQDLIKGLPRPFGVICILIQFMSNVKFFCGPDCSLVNGFKVFIASNIARGGVRHS